MIALGTPKELIAKVGGEDIVEFAVSQRSDSRHAENPPHAVVDLEALKAIPGVQSHRVDEACISFQ